MRVRRKAHYERKYRAKRAASLSRSVVSRGSHFDDLAAVAFHIGSKLLQPEFAACGRRRRSGASVVTVPKIAMNCSNSDLI